MAALSHGPDGIREWQAGPFLHVNSSLVCSPNPFHSINHLYQVTPPPPQPDERDIATCTLPLSSLWCTQWSNSGATCPA